MHKLTIHLFGRPRSELDGEILDIKRRKVAALLIYLSVTRKSHRREYLAEMLYPNRDPGHTSGNFRQVLSHLKGAIGSNLVVADRATVNLDNFEDIWVDVHVFRQLVQSFDGLPQALELYRDDFISGFYVSDTPEFEDWITVERENLRLLCSGAFEKLSLHRIVTLTGPGGSGKTRLAIEAAKTLSTVYRDRVWFIDLTSVEDFDSIPIRFASILGIRRLPESTLLKTLLDSVQKRRMLIIMDNCEQLIDACAKFTHMVLSCCDGADVLATSREPLAVSGELLWHVGSLLEPDSIRLFLDRAQMIVPGFIANKNSRTIIAEICRHLEGIPLAIELAAGRVLSMPLSSIFERIIGHPELLSGGTKDGATRHRTLWATIEWSYKLLSDDEQKLFRWLSVFDGGRTLEAAEGVCDAAFEKKGVGDLTDGRVIDLASRLVTKSLIRMDDAEHGVRYRFLEMIRQYARQKLVDSGEQAHAKEHHRHWFTVLAEKAEPELFGRDGPGWTEYLEPEQGNFIAAMSWSLEQGETAQCLRVSGSIWYFWFIRGRLEEGRRYLEVALPGEDDSFPAARANALCGLSFVAWFLDYDSEKAGGYCRQAIELAGQINAREMMVRQLAYYGKIVAIQGRVGDSMPIFARAFAIAKGTDDSYGKALCFRLQGEAFEESAGEREQGKKLQEKSLEIFVGLGNKRQIGQVMQNLGGIEIDGGNYDRATELLEESFAFLSEAGDKYWISRATCGLGHIAFRRHEIKKGISLFANAMTTVLQLGMQGSFLELVEALVIEFSAGHYMVFGARLSGAADVLRSAKGTPPDFAGSRSAYDRAIKALRKNLTESAFKDAASAGGRMTMEQVLDFISSESFL